MRTHEAKLKAMASELREHRAAQQGKKARGKEAEELRQKEAYLEFEVSLLGTSATHKLRSGRGVSPGVELGRWPCAGCPIPQSAVSLPVEQGWHFTPTRVPE